MDVCKAFDWGGDNIMKREQNLCGQEDLGSDPGSVTSGCLTLGKGINVFEPQCPLL